jgi:splicing factor 3B subunit 4
MSGQYFGSKEIVVQYAFKKDGKGERHGDEAERMLAAQAKKHNVQLPVQPQLFAPPGAVPAAMLNGDVRVGMGSPMNLSAAFAPPAVTPVGFQTAPGQGRGMTPANPLGPPPTGLPPRPPPSMTGYAGPPGGGYASPGGYAPPGFGGAPGAPQSYPPGFAPAPAGSAPPGAPPGFAPPPGFQHAYGNR